MTECMTKQDQWSAFKGAEKGFLLHARNLHKHARVREHCNGAYLDYLDTSCSTLMQMRTVKLSPTDFGYFSCNSLNDRTEKYLLFIVRMKR